nr:metalloregulator ArsR/SmtB family transcription factor [Frankia sp. EI5c]
MAGAEELDGVFRALADPTRRQLLERLRERDGQTLSDLCGGLAMARQSATQHLAVLEAANLISTVRRGREKLHYLQPLPINEIQARWLGQFDHHPRPPRRAPAAGGTRPAPNGVIDEPTYICTCVTYIESSAERVWHALTDAELTAAYWGHSNVSDWREGSAWEHRRTDGSGVADAGGTVLAAQPPRRLVITFGDLGEAPAGGPSTVTFEIEQYHEIVRLTVTQCNLADQDALTVVSAGWPAVFANLKSLLETGRPLPRAPWEMPARPPAGP